MSNWFDRTSWQWRLRRWRNAWDDLRGRATAGRQQVAYRHKICPSCGSLVDAGDATCPRCAAAVGSQVAQKGRRVLRVLVPGECPVTVLLLCINLGIAFFTLQPSGVWYRALMQVASLIPPLVLQQDEWYRLLTYGFLHGNLLHIGFNMMALYQMGPLLEPAVGSKRFFVLYIITMATGGAADLLFRGQTFVVAVGASGALCGLIGGGIAYAHQRGEREIRDALINWVGGMVVYSILFEVVGGIHVDHLAHGGGLVGGLLLGTLLGREEFLAGSTAARNADLAWSLAMVICFVATGLAFVQGFLAMRALPF